MRLRGEGEETVERRLREPLELEPLELEPLELEPLELEPLELEPLELEPLELEPLELEPLELEPLELEPLELEPLELEPLELEPLELEPLELEPLELEPLELEPLELEPLELEPLELEPLELEPLELEPLELEPLELEPLELEPLELEPLELEPLELEPLELEPLELEPLDFYNWETQVSTSNASTNYQVIAENSSGLLFKNKTDRKILNVDPKMDREREMVLLSDRQREREMVLLSDRWTDRERDGAVSDRRTERRGQRREKMVLCQTDGQKREKMVLLVSRVKWPDGTEEEMVLFVQTDGTREREDGAVVRQMDRAERDGCCCQTDWTRERDEGAAVRQLDREREMVSAVRQTERERDGAGCQTDGQTEREIVLLSDRQTERERDGAAVRQTDRQRERWCCCQTDRQTERERDDSPHHHQRPQSPVKPVEVVGAVWDFIQQRCTNELEKIRGGDVSIQPPDKQTHKPPDKVKVIFKANDPVRAHFPRERFIAFYQRLTTDLQVRSCSLDPPDIKKKPAECVSRALVCKHPRYCDRALRENCEIEGFSMDRWHSKFQFHWYTTTSPDTTQSNHRGLWYRDFTQQLALTPPKASPGPLVPRVHTTSTQTKKKRRVQFVWTPLKTNVNTLSVKAVWSRRSKPNQCEAVYGQLKGTQPKGGTMTVTKERSSLSGYEKCATIVIQYHIPTGIQKCFIVLTTNVCSGTKEEHPNPGQSYHGAHHIQHISQTPQREGKFWGFLKRAIDQQLVFAIG
ncbi:unnamed protein product [Coregonus sp. 'balchen']|nr:unnamed protein product [Coregonus sp. 'balchen']